MRVHMIICVAPFRDEMIIIVIIMVVVDDQKILL